MCYKVYCYDLMFTRPFQGFVPAQVYQMMLFVFFAFVTWSSVKASCQQILVSFLQMLIDWPDIKPQIQRTKSRLFIFKGKPKDLIVSKRLRFQEIGQNWSKKENGWRNGEGVGLRVPTTSIQTTSSAAFGLRGVE